MISIQSANDATRPVLEASDDLQVADDAVGLSTDTLHLVIGAMVISPAFEPLAQIPLGCIVQELRWR